MLLEILEIEESIHPKLSSSAMMQNPEFVNIAEEIFSCWPYSQQKKYRLQQRLNKLNEFGLKSIGR